MAGEQQQNDLRAVVENLVTHPGFRRIVSDAVQQSTSDQNVTASTSAMSTPNATRARFSSPHEEMQALFRTGGRGRGGGTVASFVPVLGSSRFNARSARSRTHSCKNSKAKTKKFTREVVLLSKPDQKNVVRGNNKAELMRKGQVIQCFQFVKEWTEEEVFENLKGAFADILQDTRFEIMLGIGNELVKPNLMGKKLDGEKISKLFSQKTVWLLPENELSLSDDDDDDVPQPIPSTQSASKSAQCSMTGDQFPTITAHFPAISSQTPSTSAELDTTTAQPPDCCAQNCADAVQSPTINPLYSTTSAQSSIEDFKTQLHEMFPNKELAAIERAINNSSDLEGAISKLLDETNEFADSSDDEILNSTLIGTKKVKLNPIDYLKRFVRQVKVGRSEEHFFITREKSFISQIIAKYKKPTFDLGDQLSVEFRSFDADEFGVDAGGPTKEFFKELMKELETGGFKGIRFFEGEKDHLTPTYDYDLLSSGMFQIVGKMILHSVLNGCRGIAGLSSAVKNYILTGSRDTILEFLTVDDIPDPCLRQSLKELTKCGDDDLEKFTDSDSACNIADILIASGFPHLQVSPSNRQLAYECCLSHEAIIKRIPSLDDLRKGLSTKTMYGGQTLLNLGEEHRDIRYIIFPEANLLIDLRDVMKLIEYTMIEDADATNAKLFFEKYLVELSERDSEDQESLQDLIQLWTGWPSLPTMGEKLKVAFLPKDARITMPAVDFCFNLMKIPTIHEDYDAFQKVMDISIGYGKVGCGRL